MDIPLIEKKDFFLLKVCHNQYRIGILIYKKNCFRTENKFDVTLMAKVDIYWFDVDSFLMLHFSKIKARFPLIKRLFFPKQCTINIE